MAASNGVWMMTIMSTLSLAAKGELTCTSLEYLSSRLKCVSPDNEDYVLKRDVLPDNGWTEIILNGCLITDIETGSFQHLRTREVTSITLSNNIIQSLNPGVFDGTEDLNRLYLSDNVLTGISLGLFDQNPKLEVLDLSRNKIKSNLLKRGVFDSLTKLDHLDLSHNAIFGSELDPFIFDHSRQVNKVDFSGNDMSNTPDNLLYAFWRLRNLNLIGCHLTEVSKFATAGNLRTMTELDLSSNRISRIDDPTTFINLSSLRILNLASNSLEIINENVFKALKSLEVILLNNNFLKSLPDNLFQNIVNVSKLDLSYNLIEYVPDDAFWGTRLKTLNLAFNRLTYLPDKFISSLKNSAPQLFEVYFNQNPWQCACLMEVLKEANTLEISYDNRWIIEYSNIFDGKEPVCVTTAEFKCKRNRDFNQFYTEYYNLIKRKLIHY